MRWSSADGLRKLGRGYGGFLLLIECSILAVASFSVFLLMLHGRLSPQTLYDPVFLSYCVQYWRAHPAFAIVTIALIASLCLVFDRVVYDRYFRPTWYWHLSTRFRKRRMTISVILGCGLLGAGVVLPPLFHLYYPGWVRASLAALPLPLLLIEYSLLFGREVTDLVFVRSINRYRMEQTTWNVGAHGVPSARAESDLDVYDRIVAQYGKISAEAVAFIERGQEGTIWKGNDSFIRQLAGLFGAGETTLQLFDRTTDAVDHALREAIQLTHGRRGPKHTPVVVTTDAEFDTVSRLLDSKAEDGIVQLRRVGAREKMWDGLTESDIRRDLAEQIDKDADIVCISNVFYETGVELRIGELVKASEGQGNEAIWIVDGAQAVGNIAIRGEIIDTVHYYATSAHKWLGGSSALGVLYRMPGLPKDDSSTRSFSAVGDQRPSGTIELAGHISANAMVREMAEIGLERIEEHNRTLGDVVAGLLCDRLALSRVGSGPTNGIVTLRGEGDRVKKVVHGLARRGINITHYPARSAMRICCHYYHSEADVYRLVGQALRA